MELARVLTELSNAHSSEPEATFSDAMATPLSFLQPRAAAHTSSSHPRVQTNAASNDTFDGSDDEASERRPKIIERRRQRKRMKQQRSSNTSAAAMSDDDAPRRSDAKYVSVCIVDVDCVVRTNTELFANHADLSARGSYRTCASSATARARSARSRRCSSARSSSQWTMRDSNVRSAPGSHCHELTLLPFA